MAAGRSCQGDAKLEEITMGMVMIRCPETGSAIPTGIKTDGERFFSRTYCRICAATHEWFAKEAWVYESVPAKGKSGGRRSPRADAA
jgi:hypothetical protein